MTARVITIDRGWRKAKRNFRALNGKAVITGVLIPDVARYAVTLEYGDPSRGQSERPFMRRGWDKSEAALALVTRRTVMEAISGVGSLTVDLLLQRIARWLIRRIREQIATATDWAAPVKSYTKRTKKTGATLIETGRLLGSIAGRVTTLGAVRRRQASEGAG